MSALCELNRRYEVVVIGGGVHGAAVALRAASLGHQVLLVERGDFCSGVSANTLRFIHGGLRYLQSADLRRSRESAREQQRLLAAAPHLVRPLSCLVGTHGRGPRGRLAMAAGLWFYDHLVRLGLGAVGRGRLLSRAAARRRLGPDLLRGATGAALWQEAQVLDSERLVLSALKTAQRRGAHIHNYTAATALRRGAALELDLADPESGASRCVEAGVVIDTGSWLAPHPGWARAVNLVVKRPLADCALGLTLPGGDGRLFFATPLAGHTLIGTWYFPDRTAQGGRLSREEFDTCLADARALAPQLDIGEADVTRIHLGRLPVRDAARPLSLLERPLIRPLDGDRRVLRLSGVKYTAAGPAARAALRRAGLERRGQDPGDGPWYGAEHDRETTTARIRARTSGLDEAVITRLYAQYGSVATAIVALAAERPGGFEPIPGTVAIRAEIDYCVAEEQCRTLADFLLRRSGLGSLGAPAAATVRYCAAAMAARHGWDAARTEAEIAALDAVYFPLAEHRRCGPAQSPEHSAGERPDS